jgi:tetratricopeptide (TPR) repeat protein
MPRPYVLTRGFMKRVVLLFCMFALTCFAEQSSWRENYEKGLQLQAQGQYEEAASYLKMALADKPISEVSQDQKETFEYLPYLQLGICYFHLGKTSLASEYFEIENSLTALNSSKGGKRLMQEYKTKLSQQKTEANPQQDEVIRKFEKKPYVLSDIEVAKMKEDIRLRCELPKADERSYPWYYHYELGLALSSRSDWQRALDSFLTALDHRDRPQKFTRIYGMWFIDYYPYYNIGLAHYHLQNWKCAESSFRLSQMFEDIPRNTNEFRNLQDYLSDALTNELQK